MHSPCDAELPKVRADVEFKPASALGQAIMDQKPRIDAMIESRKVSGRQGQQAKSGGKRSERRG